MSQKKRPTTSSSNLQRRKICPGSHRAEDGLPEDSSPEANEGTMLHALAEDPKTDRSHLSAEQLEVLEYAEALAIQATHTVLETEHLEEAGCQIGNEKEIWMRKGLKPVLGGHCDRWAFWPDSSTLLIIDYKFGRGDLPTAGDNLQLRAYAVQAQDEFGAKQVYVALIRPRIFGDGALSIAKYDADALKGAREEILGILAAIEKPDAPRAASEDACQYCKAKVTCPEYLEPLAIQAAQTEELPPVARMTNEQLALVLRAGSRLSAILEPSVKEARARIEAGTFPGWGLKPNAPRRAIADAKGALLALEREGFGVSELYEAAGLKVGAAEKLFIARGQKAAAAKAEVNRILRDFIKVNDVAPSVVEA